MKNGAMDLMRIRKARMVTTERITVRTVLTATTITTVRRVVSSALSVPVVMEAAWAVVQAIVRSVRSVLALPVLQRMPVENIVPVLPV